MTTQAFLGNGGAPRTIEHGGKVYRVRRLDLVAMNSFSEWLIGWTRSRLVALYGHDHGLLALRLADLERDVLDGVYEFGEEAIGGKKVRLDEKGVWRDEEENEVKRKGKVSDEARAKGEDFEGGAIHTHRGRVAMAAILCGCDQAEALDLITTRAAEVGHLLKLALEESFPAARREAGDPNAQEARAPA